MQDLKISIVIPVYNSQKLINNAIKIFYDYMEQNVQVGICGGNLYNLNEAPEESDMARRA